MKKLLKNLILTLTVFILLSILFAVGVFASDNNSDSMIKSLMRESGIIDEQAENFSWDNNITYSDIDVAVSKISGGNAEHRNTIINTLTKSLVTITGYGEQVELSGGSDELYLNYATKLKIIKGLDMSDDNISFIEMARMIYNTLQVDFIERSFYGSQQVSFSKTGESVMGHYFDIAENEGIVTATERSSLYSKVHADEDRIEIDNLDYRCTMHVDGHLLGRKVKVLYKNDSNLGRKVVSIQPVDSDNITEIFMTDVTNFTRTQVTYEVSEKKKEKTEIPQNAVILVNGVFSGYASSVMESEVYTADTRGIMYLIDNNNDRKIDVVSVIKYDVSVVQSVYPEKLMVICNNKNYRLTDDYNEDGFDYKVLMDGEEIGFDKIAQWDALIVEYTTNASGKNFYTLNVVRRMVQGTLTSKSDDSVTINNIEYGVHPSVNKNELKLNLTGEFIIGGSDEIIYIKPESSYSYGYFIALGDKSGLHSEYEILLVDASGEGVVYDLADKVKLSTVEGRVPARDVASYLNKQQLIGYELNGSGEISKIYYSSSDKVSSDHNCDDHKGEFSLCVEQKVREYIVSSGFTPNLSWEIFPVNGTIVFFVDDSDGDGIVDEDDVDVGSFSGWELQDEADCMAYDCNNVKEPKVVVVNASVKTTFSENRSNYEMIVKDLRYARDSDDEFRAQLIYYDHTGEEHKAFFADEVTKITNESTTNGTPIPSRYQTGTHLDLKAGDVIKVAKNSDGDIISYLQLFKADAEHIIGEYIANNQNPLPSRDQVYSTVKYISGNKFVLPCDLDGKMTDRVFENSSNTTVYRYIRSDETLEKVSFADFEPSTSAVYTTNGSEVFVVRLYGVIHIMIIVE